MYRILCLLTGEYLLQRSNLQHGCLFSHYEVTSHNASSKDITKYSIAEYESHQQALKHLTDELDAGFALTDTCAIYPADTPNMLDLFEIVYV